MAEETSAGILAWGNETFGIVSDPLALFRRAQTEMEELAEAITAGNSQACAAEAADVVILLHRLMGLMDRDLADEVDAKMAVNRQRVWRTSGDGTGHHIGP